MVTLRWVVGILQELQDEHRKRTKACLRRSVFISCAVQVEILINSRCRKRIGNMNLGYSTSDITMAAAYDWTPYFERLAVQKMTRKGTVYLPTLRPQIYRSIQSSVLTKTSWSIPFASVLSNDCGAPARMRLVLYASVTERPCPLASGGISLQREIS